MKQSLLLLFFFPSLFTMAQKPMATNVLQAERSFAAYSVEHGTKEAFLKFLDSTGVVFEKGKAVNGIKAWNKKEKGTGVLNWHPVFGDIAASGDLGFTTGPWTFQQNTINDSVVARGQYSTVWKKGKDGSWKFIVDLGINKTPAFTDALYKFDDQVRTFVPGTWNNLLNEEEKLISQTKDADYAQRRKIYEDVLSKKTFFLNRNGSLPAVDLKDVGKALQSLPQMIEYSVGSLGISAAGDLGYVYGTTYINRQTENYLRIWQREGKAWKLVLEVLRY